MSETNDNGVVTLPSALDRLNQYNYASDAAQLEAADDLTMKRNSKVFKEALQTVQAKYFERKAVETKQQMRQETEELKKKIVLDLAETEKIKIQATEKAHADLKAGTNAIKHGLNSRRILSEDDQELLQSGKSLLLTDLLWDCICLQYAAIIRAQRIMFVMGPEDHNLQPIA